MTARMDATMWLDGETAVHAQTLQPTTDGAPRALVGIGDLLLIMGPVDTLRATLTAALAALDGLQP